MSTREQDRVDAATLTLFLIGGGLVVLAAAVLLSAYFNVSAREFAERRANAVQDELTAELRETRKAAMGDIESSMQEVLEAASQSAPSLVPAVGAHDRPTRTPGEVSPRDVSAERSEREP